MDKPPVLAIEDNAIQRRLLSLLGEKLALNLTVVESCAAAVEAVQNSSFSLILLDWSLGDADGSECARRIRELDSLRHEHTPIIAVTGRVMYGDREDCLRAGADDYLSKPFSFDQFRTAVHKWLRWKQHHVVKFVPQGDWQTTDLGRGAGDLS